MDTIYAWIGAVGIYLKGRESSMVFLSFILTLLNPGPQDVSRLPDLCRQSVVFDCPASVLACLRASAEDPKVKLVCRHTVGVTEKGKTRKCMKDAGVKWSKARGRRG